MVDIASLYELARGHDGIFTLHEASRLGFSLRRLRALGCRGQVCEVHPFVFRFPAVPLTPRSKIRAATMASGSCAVASHSSAAFLLGLDDTPAGRPETTTTASVAPALEGVRVHRTRHLPGDDTTTVGDALRCTSASRTIIDLCPRLAKSQRIELVDRAICAGAANRARLHIRSQQLSRGRPGVRTVVDVTAPAADGVYWSALERCFGDGIRNSDLAMPVFNAPLRYRNRLIYVDALWVDAALAVELRGVRFHSSSRARIRDDERHNVMTHLRLRSLIFGWREVTEDFAGVAAQISRALTTRPATPRT